MYLKSFLPDSNERTLITSQESYRWTKEALILPQGVEPCVIGYKPISQNRREQAAYKPVVGIEPTSSAWKADILAVVLHGQNHLSEARTRISAVKGRYPSPVRR